MLTEPRRRLIDWIRQQLIGPPESAPDSQALQGVLPTERFPCGALYPTSKWGEGIDPASEDVGVYPRVDRSLLDQEEQEIELQYANRHIYAIGHGCAANWEMKDGKVVELRSESMPAVEVPQMTADTGSGGEPVLSLARLADIDKAHTTLLPELEDFISGYANWVANQQGSIPGLPADDLAAASRMVERMNTAVSRMRAGLSLLGDNAQARLAFALANCAMLDQSG